RQLVADPGYPAECTIDRPASSPWQIGNPIWTRCSDLLTGARIEGKLPVRLRLAAHYAYIDFGEQIASGLDESVHVAGGDLTGKRIGDRWDLFVGGAALVRLRDAPELDAPALEGVDYLGHAA